MMQGLDELMWRRAWPAWMPKARWVLGGVVCGLAMCMTDAVGCANVTGVQVRPDGDTGDPVYRDGGPDAAAALDAGASDAAEPDGAELDVAATDAAPPDPCENVVCNGDQVCEDGSCVNPDADNDGYRAHEGDCNDADPSIHPGATEVCDGVDQDCDNQIDEGDVCPSPTRATATGLGSGDPDTGLQPDVTLISGDMGDLQVQPYVSIGADAYEWGLSCTHGPAASCTLSCSGTGYTTYTPTPNDCFTDDEEWRASCTLTVECP